MLSDDYVETEEVVVPLAEEIFAVVTAKNARLIFDASVMRTKRGFTKFENFDHNKNEIKTFRLAEEDTNLDTWENLDMARAMAMIGLERKDGKKIVWQ